MAPASSEQLPLTPHCHDAPPILGPLPKSGGGRKTTSSLNFARRFTAVQVPLYKIADLPFAKSAAGSAPDLSGMYLLVTRPRNQVAHLMAASPFSAPSADL